MDTSYFLGCEALISKVAASLLPLPQGEPALGFPACVGAKAPNAGVKGRGEGEMTVETKFHFASRRVSLFCLSKIKIPNKTTPLCRLFPALLVPVGGNRTRPSGLHKPQAAAELKQAIAENSHLHCAARHGRKGLQWSMEVSG